MFWAREGSLCTTFIADCTMFVELMRVEGRYAAVITNKGDEFGDDENYAALGFYTAVGEEYSLDD